MNALQRNIYASNTELSLLHISDIQWNNPQRKIRIGQRTITFTPAEFRLLSPLHQGQPVTYAQLAMAAYGCTVDRKVREMMDKHIDRIRGKLEGSGIYIYCVLGYGYVLMPTIPYEEADQQVAG
jgi:DNA-binding response OmpR family regulator